ncbi:ESX secretion-associated protein EspG [Mycobacterium intermedium]|uniref:ESX secretion-associated protein EspG n=1 Tax=Mycobacterium intermedium TaxID=28445 RepID=A0A1E3S8Q9_MYCIE|nr:ESX secretion-associated protein EspG [Mycobacterium intermedium]MCV6967326.1 ESX secretion-associated protein EspG [Mycobacterium intermedium]ODQ98553.1 secretion protein EspG [Mycobacterium intermedium]OPE46149.1 ESX secretion-associated protein EspG [Mycobacterium intermedium]ORB08208.1 ESX secretion-associated protein EspG [Mycobacterium intermedium]
MLTTTVDGLWALQVLAGIESVAPELGLRPHLPSVEPKQLALAHPVMGDLRCAGVVDESDQVDPTVVEWLTVLSRRDVALFVQICVPGADELARALLARFAQWWVVMERSAALVRISGAGTASAETSASAVVSAELERLCGDLESAQLRPVTLDAEALRAAATSQDAVRAFLEDQRLEADQLQTLLLAADPNRSARASVVAIQCGVATGKFHRSHVDEGAVTVIDTPAGRLVAEDVHSAGRKWMIIAPGTKSNIAVAINQMVRRLPAEQEWFSYRKVV